jgi:hypothetical protein
MNLIICVLQFRLKLGRKKPDQTHAQVAAEVKEQYLTIEVEICSVICAVTDSYHRPTVTSSLRQHTPAWIDPS